MAQAMPTGRTLLTIDARTGGGAGDRRYQRRRTTVGTALVLLLLAGCADEQGAMQALGSGIGAGVGAVLGSQIGSGAGRVIATSAGAAMGSFFGGKAFQKLAEADRKLAYDAQHRALEDTPSGQEVPWRNPDSGNAGRVTAYPAFESDTNAPCRKFTHVVDLMGEGDVTAASGIACRNRDGSWRLVQQDG